jgi:ABC-type antimicrobial peptide transport system permease subunit
MNRLSFATRGFIHNWKLNLAVILGVAAGTAVLVGALLVGDSVRGSLRALAIERLGTIDTILLADHFFGQSLGQRIQSSQDFPASFAQAIPVILLANAAADHRSGDSLSSAAQVAVLGCTSAFWQQGDALPIAMEGRTVVVNQPLAEQLNVSVGDKITLRVGGSSAIAADSPLANRDDMARSLADVTVSHIIPAEGLGRFSLNPSQHLPRNAYVPLELLQTSLKREGKVNAVLICRSRGDDNSPVEADGALQGMIRPSLTDAGLTWTEVHREYRDESTNESRTAYRYYSLSTDRMVFPPEASRAIEGALRGLVFQPVFTYLANSIEVPGSQTQVPYSTISAVDSIAGLGPLLDAEGNPIEMAANQIVLNSWTAEDLGVRPGDRVRVTFFEPETTHGETIEAAEEFLLRAVVPISKPSTPYTRREPARYVDAPTRANDPDLTPTVPGITDQESIDDWDPPFPFDYRKIRQPRDEDYWDNYRTTPKAFVSLTTGQRLWGSRFGRVTSYRITAEGVGDRPIVAKIETAIADNLPAFGFSIIHARRDGIAAATGTTPFNVLFLLFSFFIVGASLALISLLFRLGVEQRAPEMGMLLSVGLSRRQTGGLILLEGVLVGAAGAVLGTVIGIGYAILIIVGLRTWWVDAVATPFLEPHFTISSLLIGALLGLVIAGLTILVTLFGLRRSTVQQLVTGNLETNRTERTRGSKAARFVSIAALGLALACAVLGIRLSGEAQAGAFFGSGALVLVALLLWTRRWLRSRIDATSIDSAHHFDLLDLVVRNVARNTGRSVLTIGLMAAACFVIIAVSAFRLAPSREGTAGFEFVGTSELPIFADLNDGQVRENLFGSDAAKLDGTTILSLRYQDGEDASCRNLYQAHRPRILGVTRQFIEYFERDPANGFRWSASAAASDDEKANPWRLLERSPGDEPVPVVLDKNTALYSLHLYGGIGEVFELDYGLGNKIEFRVAGLLSNSILQGSLLIGERDLVRLFPRVGGYRYFLIDTPDSQALSVAGQLEQTFRDQGFDASDTNELLRDLLAVQNTYLSTFQSLGGLGLLLGTFGLMAVQLRNVWQRRDEISLLRAAGFSRDRVGQSILLEHGFLLIAGLGIGAISALLTVLPHIVFGGASLPLSATLWMLLLILFVGLATGWLAVRNASRLPILRTLRGS